MPVVLNGEIVPEDDPRAIAFRRQQNIYHSSQQYQRAQQEAAAAAADQSDAGYRAFDNVRDDPFAASMMLCFLCLLVLLAGFLVWLFIMELNVGFWSLKHKVECDKPLAIYIIGEALSDLALFLITIWFSAWVYRHRDNAMAEVNRTEIIMLIWCGMMVLLFSGVWLVMGNIWLFTSKTCRETSKGRIPPPKALMYSVYDAASLVVLINDMTLIFKLLDWCIRRAVARTANIEDGYVHPHDENISRQAAGNMIFTPAGAWYWVSLLAAPTRNQRAREDYHNV